MKRRDESFFFLLIGLLRKNLARMPLARFWDYAEIPLFPQTK